MAFDFKKEYKEFYLPPAAPAIVELPQASYLAARGTGNPNDETGAYSTAMTLLYAVAYTIKMSYKGAYKISGFFEYVVPPLEGLWWQDGTAGIDYTRKENFHWISMLRLPDFVAKKDVDWAVAEASQKKKLDCSAVEFLTYDEGVCVQCMHIGPYDNEPETICGMDSFAASEGYAIDISAARFHHEIYLSDPRKTEPAKLKTIIRHPVKIQNTGT